MKVGGQSQIPPLSVIVRLPIAEPGTPCEMRREYKHQSNSWWFNKMARRRIIVQNDWANSRHSTKVTCNPAHAMSGLEIWSQENMTHLNKWWQLSIKSESKSATHCFAWSSHFRPLWITTLFMVFDAVFLHFPFIQLVNLAFFLILAMGGSCRNGMYYVRGAWQWYVEEHMTWFTTCLSSCTTKQRDLCEKAPVGLVVFLCMERLLWGQLLFTYRAYLYTCK